MFKTTLLAAALGLALAAPASAETAKTAKCDNPSMQKLQTEVDGMKDPAMKEQKAMAMKEMDMAKKAMESNNMEMCATHMNKAMEEMHKS